MAVVWLVDKSTGEAEEYKRKYRGRSFWKLHMKDFIDVLRAFKNKQLNVLAYILEHTKASTNTFTGTYRGISKACNVSLATVTQVMSLLQKKGFMKKLQNGIYIISPDILMKGDEMKRGRLLCDYGLATRDMAAPKGEADTGTDASPAESAECTREDEG